MSVSRLLSRRAFAVAITAVAGLAGLGSAAHAQQYPNKPIRMVVGFAAGGLTDVLARLVAAEMSKTLGQQVVVENVGGAGGNIGTAQVTRARPDGYTILFSNVGQICVNPHTYKSMDVDPLNGLEHIGGVGDIFFLMAVSGKVPVNTAAEFVALAKSKPGQLNYYTSAPGGMVHVVAELFKQMTATDIKGVHYKGSGQALPEFLAGETQLGIEALPVLAAHVKEGRVKGLMVTSKTRSTVLPDVPTVAEAGYPDFLYSAWFGLHTTKGTPPDVLAKLTSALHAAVKNEAVQKKMTDSGSQPIVDTPAEFTARVKSDHTQFGAVAKAANITIE